MKKLILALIVAFAFASCSSAKMELPYCWGKKDISKGSLSKASCKAKKAIDNLKEKLADRKDELVD